MADLMNPIFSDEDKARKHLERLRWPHGPNCPHCGNVDPDKITALNGKSHRPGLYQCNACEGHFSVTVGTVMERSHIPLHKWVFAFHLMNASKKGMSAHQMHRMLGITYKSAWFMCHRIREAMRDANPTPMGGEGKNIRADETYYGNTSKRSKTYRKGHKHKSHIVGLCDPETKKVRTFHTKGATAKTVREILVTNADRKSRLVTDESRLYSKVGTEFADHSRVCHNAGEYVNKEGFSTNNIENFFGIFKKGMAGVYHFCGQQHVSRYLDEFTFRYSNRETTDSERAALAIKGIEGKRLTYRQPN